MTQNTEIKISSSTQPFALTEADKQPSWVIFKQEFDDKKTIHIDELKQIFPACQQILSLLLHLHSDCANPDTATYKTLNWLANIIQNNRPIHTHLCFANGAGTGKSLFINDILKPVFGQLANEMPAESEKFNARLNIVNISNNCAKTMLDAQRKLTFAKMSDKPRNALLFCTNQLIQPDPANRRFRIARCSTRLDDALYKAVMSEITNGGLMQFADLLHTIYGSTDKLHNLNAIY